MALTFVIKEGPTVKVGKIAFTGNHALSHRQLVAAMKNLKPIGIPHSIILENLFARTFDASKLDEDADRVRQAYRDKGYFKALTGEPQTNVRNAGGINPFTLHPSHGKRVDIVMPIEEGERYRLGGITFTGNKAFTNVKALRAQFPVKGWRLVQRHAVRQGHGKLAQGLRRRLATSTWWPPRPHGSTRPRSLVYLDIDIDEGKQFYVSRIEFTGNTVTRDKVIRRELLLEEGQVYNSQLWELSHPAAEPVELLRDRSRPTRTRRAARTPTTGTVDLLLKLKEKGKNSIGLNGGVSGLSGTLHRPELSDQQLPRPGRDAVAARRTSATWRATISFGFTEPYLRNKPISVGFQVFDSKRDYNPAKATRSPAAEREPDDAQHSQLKNYNTSTTGYDVLGERAAAASVRRLGRGAHRSLVWLSRSSITTFNKNTHNVFQSLAFRSGIQGQNQLNGIVTSVFTPSFTFSTLDRAVGPHQRQGLQCRGADRGRGRQREVLLSRWSLPPVLPDEGPADQQGRPQRPRLSHPGSARCRFWWRRRSADARIYGGGENDRARLRHSLHLRPTPLSRQDSVQPDQPGRNRGPARSHQPNAGQCADSAAHLSPGRRSAAIPSLTANLEYRIPIVTR